MREPVVKDLAGAKKTTKIAGIAVETHQATILAAHPDLLRRILLLSRRLLRPLNHPRGYLDLTAHPGGPGLRLL